MFALNCLLLVAAAAVVVMAAPVPAPLSFDLNDMINNTVCAIQVTINSNTNRIPEHIKYITCAAPTNRICVANNITDQYCCHNQMECVEMRDTIMVYDKNKKTTIPIEVPVGCACRITPISNSSSSLEADSNRFAT